ncbi:MAG: hypothetical protein OXC44_00195 [Proteobacteria bacterium]|nr:hypothetical protein [Pseudomonadota bacterium]
MQNKTHYHLLYTLAWTLFLAATSVSCGSSNHTTPQSQDESQLSSASNKSSHFVIADAKDDSSSLTFYSCSVSNKETDKLKDPAAHPQNCVSAYKNSDGEPLTVSKEQMKSNDHQNSLAQHLENLKQTHQSDINDRKIIKADVGQQMTYYYLFVASAAAILAGILATKSLQVVLLTTGALGMVYVGHGTTMSKIRRNSRSNSSKWPTLGNIAKNDSQEAKQLNANLKSALESYDQLSKNTSQRKLDFDGKFFRKFAKILEDTKLVKENEIFEYCQITSEIKCSTI